MKFVEKVRQLIDAGKSASDMQQTINVSEVWHIWNMLNDRYHIIDTTQLFHNFVEDSDFKVVITLGLDELKKQTKN